MQPSRETSRFQNWISRVEAGTAPTIALFDFDGTLTPRFADDEAHYDFVAQTSNGMLTNLLNRPHVMSGICSARAVLEVERIASLGLTRENGESLAGFCAAENGSVLVSGRLSEDIHKKLVLSGLSVDLSQPKLTIINLAKLSPEDIMSRVVSPSAEKSNISELDWVSSGSNLADPATFRKLVELSRHPDPETTHRACLRFGSVYLKINANEQGARFVGELQRVSELHGVFCLVTPPLDNHPIWSVDLGGGVTKADALRSISQAYSVITDRPEEHFRFIFFGDGRNDLPAFDYISSRSGESFAFLVDSPHGNQQLAYEAAPGTIFLEGKANLAGVHVGLQQLAARSLL